MLLAFRLAGLSALEAHYADHIALTQSGRARCRMKRLTAQHGNAKLTELLATLADCAKARSVNVHDRCKARYEGL
jgi:hypothetical protein